VSELLPDAQRAIEALRSGELVVIPTDTVYGLAVALDADDGVRRVFEAKGRPEFRPLPVLGSSVGALQAIAVLDARARKLADAHWPGPVTLVLPRAVGFETFLGTGGEETVAVRVPAHDVALSILEATGPLAVTSANASGATPAETAAAAEAALGETVSVYVDAGECAGAPSTIVSLVGEPHVIRPGALHIDLGDQRP
jgi:L-threonylcarbamoyladenylate synthase